MQETGPRDGPRDWRALDGGLSTWFDTGSLTLGAALVGRVAELVGDGRLPDMDLRTSGVRVRIGASSPEGPGGGDLALAREVSQAARDLGLRADPAALHALRVAVGTAAPSALTAFWQPVLGYRASRGELHDPARRWPSFSFSDQGGPGPLRGRVHVDVVRPTAAVEQAKATVGVAVSGVYGLTLTDPDGNEVDLVPGDPLPGGAGTADWQVVFGAVTRYRTGTPAESVRLVEVVAGVAQEAGVPLLVDLRDDAVILDSGKDRWDDDLSGGRFVDLAAQVQAAARSMGHTADTTGMQFVQLSIDAVAVEAVSRFWATVLGYQHDPREHVTDLYDPRWLTPVVIFQEMEATEEARLRQRPHIRLELVLPVDQADARVEAAVAAGGRVLSSTAGRRTLADSEGNEVDVVTA